MNESLKSFKNIIIKKIRSKSIDPLYIKTIDNIDEKCSLCYEKFLIQLIGRRDLNLGPLTNLTNGGEGISNPSNSVRLKWKISRSGENHPLYHKFGKDHPSYGSKRTDETKTKMRLSKEGKIQSEESKKKISVYRKGKKHSEETKLKMSLSKKGRFLGENNPNFKSGEFSKSI